MQIDLETRFGLFSPVGRGSVKSATSSHAINGY